MQMYLEADVDTSILADEKIAVDVILGRDTNRVPAECGLRVIELTQAAWKSAELGRVVKVAELA